MAEDDEATPSFRYFWDVFLSFRGEDTRHHFTADLYNNLVSKGIRTFLDDKGLERGEEIAPTLVEAIKDSAAAVAVISRNYASSKWCLEELATILLDRKKLLFPVFYDVDPSDVRRQKGPFEEAFEKLAAVEQVGAEKLLRWRNAMKKAGEIAGWDSRIWEESELIQSVIKKILAKLNNTPLGVAKYPVGLGPRIDQLCNNLNVKANGVKIFVLCGMGGIGKTTLAKALYNKLVVHFKKRCFMSNIREATRKPDGITSLQSKLIGDLTSGSLPTIKDASKGILLIKEITDEKPVLLVLDDVDNAEQVHMLAGGGDWFFDGSRIIITTRDRNVVPAALVDAFFDIEELSFDESLQLFSYHAFGRDEPTKDFLDLSHQVVSLTRGLPLALEVFGASLFYRRTKREWEDAVEKLKRIRPGVLQDVLEISFSGLDEEEKCIFLDIACFFVQMNLKREEAIDIFNGCGFNAETAISDLTAKSLVKIIEDDVLWMHDQLRDMGRQIVQRENFEDAGRRSRLWDHEEIAMVLKNQMGTRSIQGVTFQFERKRDMSSEKSEPENIKQSHCLASGFELLKQMYKKYVSADLYTDDGKLYAKAFHPMANLRLLQINYVNLTGNLKLVPSKLKWLQWKGCPLEVLPSNFLPQDLAILDLSESKVKRLWDSYGKNAKKLRILNLCHCYALEEIPNLSGLQLEKLVMEHCSGLVEIHKSIGDMNKLTYLNLKDCKNLVKFPDDVGGLKSLQKLVLSGCSNLRELPDDMSGLRCLRELFVDKTAIQKLPNSIFRLKSLEVLNLDDCNFLKLLPPSIGNMSSLRVLSLSASGLEEVPDSIAKLVNLEILCLRRCKSLKSMPDSIGDLKSLAELFLDNSLIESLPESIGSLSHLRHFTVSGCSSLKQLPDSISGLSCLCSLHLERSSLEKVPIQLGSLNSLEKLEMGSCEFLRSLPESLGNMISLTTLVLDYLVITELPESIGWLERLVKLSLNYCSNLKTLPASIGRLRSLQYLLMAETAITELHKELGTLSTLKVLKMGKKPISIVSQNTGGYPGEAFSAAEKKVRPATLPESFSNLSLLEDLDLKSWQITGKVPDDFSKLSSLQSLNLGENNFYGLPSSLKGLSVLKRLLLPQCKELKFLPPLPSSLIRLNLANCSALESISDLSHLGSLQELEITNCKKIIDIPGLQHLKSLRRLYTGGCQAFLPALKQRLSKVALKHIRYLCVPGSKIPSWFVQELPKYSTRKNLELKGVIIGVVISLDQKVQDSFRNKVPAIVDIQAKIIRNDVPIYTTVLYLLGVPDTSENQLYLCRFHDYNQLVFMLEDGDELQVVKREIPRFQGLDLKQFGLHLVFENDDDFDDNDDALFSDPQQSVSRRLANFFSSF